MKLSKQLLMISLLFVGTPLSATPVDWEVERVKVRTQLEKEVDEIRTGDAIKFGEGLDTLKKNVEDADNTDVEKIEKIQMLVDKLVEKRNLFWTSGMPGGNPGLEVQKEVINQIDKLKGSIINAKNLIIEKQNNAIKQLKDQVASLQQKLVRTSTQMKDFVNTLEPATSGQ